ncbi:hypothetical protein EW145_g8136, partial [Phellinidium pouzarii]
PQSDTTLKGQVTKPLLEATASSSVTTSRTTRTSELFTDLVLNSDSVLPLPTMMTETTETNLRAGEYFKQNASKVFTPQVILSQVPVQPSQPPQRTEPPLATKKIPVADTETLRTLLDLARILPSRRPAPASLSLPPRLQPWQSYVIEHYELAQAKGKVQDELRQLMCVVCATAAPILVSAMSMKSSSIDEDSFQLM